jgi:hypothetical protein
VRLKMSVEAKLGHAPRGSGYVPRSEEQPPEYVFVHARDRGAQTARPLAGQAQSEAAQVAALRELPYLQ